MTGLPTLTSLEDFCQATGLARRWVLDQAARHPDRFPSVKIAGRVMFTDEHLAVILAAHSRTAAPAPAAADVDAAARRAIEAARAWGRPTPRTRRRAS